MNQPNQIIGIAAIAILAIVVPAQADVSISNRPTQNMSCGAGICTATAKKAVLNVGDLENMLASGDATVKTGSVAKDIDIDQPLTWANTSRLTLDAFQSVAVNKPMTVSGTGGLTVITNDGGQNGAFIIGPKASVQFWDLASSLIIDGNSYTLVADIKTLSADIDANSSGYYAFAKPYDASADGTYTTSPILTDFNGRFDGLGNEISHFTMNAPAENQPLSVGLFTTIQAGAAVLHTRLTQANVTAIPGEYDLGVLAGANYGSILFSSTQGTLTISKGENGGSIGDAGGLVGFNPGVIANSEADVQITSNASGATGGLVGFLVPQFVPGAQIINSAANGSVVVGASEQAGGLVGDANCHEGFCPSILFSHATGPVTGGDDSCAGGLVGTSDSAEIKSSYATGTVTIGAKTSHTLFFSGRAGGLIGLMGAHVTNSYAFGAVKGGNHSYVGGLAGSVLTKHGYGKAHAMAAYAIGAVSGGNRALVGGYIGYEKDQKNADRFQTSYWDVDTSGTDQQSGDGVVSGGINGLSDGQLKSALPAGFDPKVWGQAPDINNGYPYLLANPPQ